MPDHPHFIRFAPLLFVSLWSTGFVAARYSMDSADPFVFLCLRFSLTALALVPILIWFKIPLPKRIWAHRHDMVTGVLLHCCYLGFLFWPIKNGMPTGIVAIIIGVQPILTMVLARLFIGESLNLRKALGLAIGFVGVATVILGKFGFALDPGSGLDYVDLGMCLISLFAIAFGVFYQKKFSDQSNLMASTLVQYMAASIATAGFALLFGESWMIDWSSGFIIALSWQVFGLSIAAVVILMFIIKLGEAGRVSSMFYLVPPLVVVEAHFLFGETLGIISILGMLMCVVGVYFVNQRTVAKVV